MCYDAVGAKKRLAKSVDRIHFDEAWYGYARFNPMYRDRFAMRGDPATHPKDGPTVFATHSTHKLLAALSQTSFIHIRDGRGAIDHGRFNEAYCSQASTSPLYALIASNDVAAAMMDGPAGSRSRRRRSTRPSRAGSRWRACIRNSSRRRSGSSRRGIADEVTRPEAGKRIPFHEASAEQLATDPNCWVLHPGESWHGFDDLPDGWCMLDPIKFGIVCPGMKDDGQLDKQGIPADIVTAYLGRHGIVPSRTTDHMVLFLFSIGVTKGKWGTLLNTLLDFKADYDRNAPLARGPARRGRGRAAALRGHGLEGSRRRDVGAPAQEQAGPLAGTGLRHAARAEDDAAPRVPAPHGRRRREGAARPRWPTASSPSA